jgi:hypothetical protein
MKHSIAILSLIFCFLYPGYKVYAQRTDGAELTLKKTFTGETMSTIKNFTVDRKLNVLTIDITGTAKSGKITIILDHYKVKSKSFEIDVTTNMEYHQTINLKKMPEYIGEWTILINAENADGSYAFSMRTSPF